jgi:hypothetical protein
MAAFGPRRKLEKRADGEPAKPQAMRKTRSARIA